MREGTKGLASGFGPSTRSGPLSTMASGLHAASAMSSSIRGWTAIITGCDGRAECEGRRG